MSCEAGVRRYGALTVYLHWVMLLLLIAVVANIELRGLYPRGSAPREMLKSAHFALGFVAFVLAWARVVIHLRLPAPPIVPPPSLLEQRLAQLMHWGLYALMIVMPITGWLILDLAGKPMTILGLSPPILFGPDKAAAHALREWHEVLVGMAVLLVALHAAAALFHHYVRRDDTLVRMLPARLDTR